MSKIIVPLPKNEKINFYLENDIDGFMIGIENFSENFNNFIKKEDILYCCTSLKQKGKDIYIVLNKLYFNDEIDGLKELLLEISKIDISGVLFDDIAVLNITKEYNLNINLIWYGIHKAVNSMTLKFLNKRGVNGALISNEITTYEILKLLDNIDIKIFVTLYGYINMATSSRTLLSNYFKYIDKEKTGKKYFIKEKNSNDYYPIIEDGNTNFFSSKVLNGIKEFPKIIKNKNIEAIYLDDYMINEYSFYNVIEAFIALKKSPCDEEFVEKLSNVVDSNNYGNTNNGFFDKKTIFKVKDYE